MKKQDYGAVQSLGAVFAEEEKHVPRPASIPLYTTVPS